MDIISYQIMSNQKLLHFKASTWVFKKLKTFQNRYTRITIYHNIFCRKMMYYILGTIIACISLTEKKNRNTFYFKKLVSIWLLLYNHKIKSSLYNQKLRLILIQSLYNSFSNSTTNFKIYKDYKNYTKKLMPSDI